MDIAISNLAFDIEDIDFLNQIKDLNIKMIEIGPTIISDWDILDIEKLRFLSQNSKISQYVLLLNAINIL
jgi:hypothetical protein